MPKVSVIIPVYNMEKYLEQCLQSVVEQTLTDIEILCINDGSTDLSESIIRHYMDIDGRIKLYTQINSGVSKARNKGIAEAKGEFVAFMDPDDYYPDVSSLAIMYDAAIENNVNICGGSFSEDHGKWIRTEFQEIYQKYTFVKNDLIEYKDYQFDYGYHRFIYRRDFLTQNNIFFPEYVRFQDPPFFVKAMITAKKFYALTILTYCYRWGHQKLKWDERRITDVLRGFIDNLKMSDENCLQELHCLTAWRMLKEYAEPIANNLDKRSVLKLLLEANAALNLEYLKSYEDLKEGIIPILLSRLDKVNTEERNQFEIKMSKAKEKKKIMHKLMYCLRKKMNIW